MDTEDILNPNPPVRTPEHCRSMLTDLISALSELTGLTYTPTYWGVPDEYPLLNITVALRANVTEFMNIEVCGVISLSINPGEFADCIAELLLFSNGKRITGPPHCDIIRFNLCPKGWSAGEWIVDENGEWERYESPDASRWQIT